MNTREIHTDCKPTICSKSDLFSGDDVYMDKETIKGWCKCQFKGVCIQIAEALDGKQIAKAQTLIEQLREQELLVLSVK